MGRTQWIALVAMLVCASTFWVWRLLVDDENRPAPAGPHEPDYYLVDMVRHSMNKQGELQNVLIADRVYHYPDDDSTELARPRMEIYNDSASPWQVTAERGERPRPGGVGAPVPVDGLGGQMATGGGFKHGLDLLTANLELARNAGGKLEKLGVQKAGANLQAVSHRQAIGKSQHLIGQLGEKLGFQHPV